MGIWRPSRRAFLAAGAVAGLGACGTRDGGTRDGVLRRRFWSAARGREVAVAAMVPPGAELATVPVCLALHGRGGRAEDMVGLGLPALLAAAGTAPYALVAVDGNRDTYWIARDPADDPQAMLLHELPGWLSGMGLTRDGGVPSAAFGVSMGCFGALVYARARGSGVRTVATLSPALFGSWAQARARNAFRDEAAWLAAEPLRHLRELPAGLRLGVWCGEQDPFAPAARTLARQVRGSTAAFAPGGHNEAYYRTVLPAIVDFLGS